MICWSLWGRRNRKAMEAQETEPLACVDGAIKIVHDFRNAMTKPTGQAWESLLGTLQADALLGEQLFTQMFRSRSMERPLLHALLWNFVSISDSRNVLLKETLGQLINSVSYTWIKRDANGADHLLAKAAACPEEGLTLPAFLFDTLRADAQMNK
ncbi:hypothetical protein Salat_2534600 [Sesamum alatum]|uniref:Uncharacterized protein n=1 Tax=Sesamum alatum TaxID=300844 RepID=A0AAE1XT32_9LAMI|nr:hypothetical protein Salat_2534600 [Sesamum alatum]